MLGILKIISIAWLAMIMVSSCGRYENPHSTYAVNGKYYSDGTVITEDGNMWGFCSSDIFNDAVNVSVVFDDNGTPDNIIDDIILCVIDKG
jgi:hypothetical protein